MHSLCVKLSISGLKDHIGPSNSTYTAFAILELRLDAIFGQVLARIRRRLRTQPVNTLDILQFENPTRYLPGSLKLLCGSFGNPPVNGPP